MNFDINDDNERLEAKNSFDGNLVFGAKRFHKETSRSGKGRPASGYIVPSHAKVIFDTGTNRYERLKEFWEPVDRCPVCLSEKSEFFLHRLGIDIHRCLCCDHRYQNPRIKFKKIVELYSNDSSPVKVYSSPVQKGIDKSKYQYGLKLLEQLNPQPKDKIIDIGCGAGGFLFEAENLGWNQCVGVDINEKWSKSFSKSTGVQFINSTFESLNSERLGGDYNVVSMWNVLEHIYDVHKTVSDIYKLLQNGGLFIVMVPNVKSLASRLMREMSPTFNWKHVSHFCENSLKTLMIKHEFKCVHLETAISEIDNIKSYMSGEYPYHGYGDPDGFFNFITPKYIHENLLGSRLIAVFQK